MAAIPITEMAANAENWRNFSANNTDRGIHLNEILPNAYMVDINAIVGETGVAKVRVYFGYK